MGDFDTGLLDASMVVGACVGEAVGNFVSWTVVGDEVVGRIVVGANVGKAVGDFDGSAVVGDEVAGRFVVGDRDGEAVGDFDGSAVVGDDVVGRLVVGDRDGEAVGEFDGSSVVGDEVAGRLVVGAEVGKAVGEFDGSSVVGADVVGRLVVGANDGKAVGEFVGLAVVGDGVIGRRVDGASAGNAVGDEVGVLLVGEVVGNSVGSAVVGDDDGKGIGDFVGVVPTVVWIVAGTIVESIARDDSSTTVIDGSAEFRLWDADDGIPAAEDVVGVGLAVETIISSFSISSFDTNGGESFIGCTKKSSRVGSCTSFDVISSRFASFDVLDKYRRCILTESSNTPAAAVPENPDTENRLNITEVLFIFKISRLTYIHAPDFLILWQLVVTLGVNNFILVRCSPPDVDAALHFAFDLFCAIDRCGRPAAARVRSIGDRIDFPPTQTRNFGERYVSTYAVDVLYLLLSESM